MTRQSLHRCAVKSISRVVYLERCRRGNVGDDFESDAEDSGGYSTQKKITKECEVIRTRNKRRTSAEMGVKKEPERILSSK